MTRTKEVLHIENIKSHNIEQEETPEYMQFVEKFKPKKTTDDCYTPPLVYEAVLNYALERYGIAREDVVRPFWPGADYQALEYQPNCCVVDNPPFSIISSICRWYSSRGIRYFLFAPYLTNFNIGPDDCTHIIAPHAVTYENGAKVATCFVTNLEPGILARSDPELCELIAKADAENLQSFKKRLPSYKYPDEVLTVSMLGYMATHGVPFEVLTCEAHFVRNLEAQGKVGKSIFGGGYLISLKAAAEKAAAEKAAGEKAAAILWTLSDRELSIINNL